MKHTKYFLVGLMILLATGAGCARQTRQKVLVVSAAASLTDILTEATELYAKQNPRLEIRLNFGSSSTLARQIEAEAPADLFCSAHPKWTDYLVDKNLVAEPSVGLYSNTLVIATRDAPPEKPLEINAQTPVDVLFGERIAVGDPEHVPVGIYARQALTALGWFELLEPRILPCGDVRASLTAVVTGEADCAIVYRTDVAAGKNMSIRAVFPTALHEPILYTAVLTTTGDAPEEGKRFLQFLTGPEGRRLGKKYGFGTP